MFPLAQERLLNSWRIQCSSGAEYAIPPPEVRLPVWGDATRPGTFDLLGFTHFWRRSRKGYWVVQRRTAESRFSRALNTTSLWLRENRHEPIAEHHRMLVKKLQGHYNYYGITGNHLALDSFGYWVRLAWCKWLCRRSNANRGHWMRISRLLEAYPLPKPRICHAV